MQALRAEILIQVQGDLAVRPGAKAVTALFEFLADGFVAVEFAIDDYPRARILACERLISRGQVDDAEPGMPEGDAPVGCDPLTLSIRTAVMQALSCPAYHRRRDRIASRKHSNNSTHSNTLSW
jgi:hypothetical protein